MTYEDVLCDANNLYKAYTASVRNSSWKGSVQKFVINFLRYIFEIQDELIEKTYKNGPTIKFELRERGRVRSITSLPTKDRIVRHVLCDELLLPAVQKKIIYDNGASVKGRGTSFSRKRLEIHLHRYFSLYGNKGFILLGDFQKFYDNIIHEIAKRELLRLFDDDEFVDWLLTVIFDGFKVDVSYMNDSEYETCMTRPFNSLEYRKIPESAHTGEKFMYKSINIGDQVSQVIGIYYPYRIDTYIKYVRSEKFYARHQDDWYIMSPSKENLLDILENIKRIGAEYGIYIHPKKTRIIRMDRPFRYLQMTYRLMDDGRILKRIRRERVTAFRKKLRKLALKVETGEVPYSNVEGMFRGWMGSFYKDISKQQRQNLLLLYEELFQKSIVMVNKKMVISDKQI